MVFPTVNNSTQLGQLGVHQSCTGDIVELSILSSVDPNSVDLGEYHVHVLTSVIKRFLQEMPEPLFTFDYYDDVILATGRLNRDDHYHFLIVVAIMMCVVSI